MDQKKKGLEDLGDRLRRNAKDVFERCRQALPADVKVHYVAQIGRPGPTILKEAEQTHTDLIIMGSRGRTGLKSLLLGSVSRYVTGHSLLPVMIVKAGEE